MSIYQKFEELEVLVQADLEHELDLKASPGQCAVVACLEQVLWELRQAKMNYEISLK